MIANAGNVFQKIGGINTLHDIVDTFYDKVLADETVNSFFKGTNMEMQRAKMKAFLMMALGGPVKFTGKEIRSAHIHLVQGGLNDVHFSAVGKHLDNALVEFKVSPEIRKVIADVVESVRKEVLNR